MNENQEPSPVSQPRTIRVAVPRVKPYATWIILGVTVFIYLLQLAGQYLLQLDLVAALGLKVNSLVRAGQLWRLITPVFLHDSTLPEGILHIGFNMYALYLYGRGIESRFGHARFVLLYFLSAYAGNVLSFLLTPNPSLGASTAIFGLLAAEGMFIFQNRRLLGGQSGRALTNLFTIAAINLIIGFTSSGIDNCGHLGGLLGGLIFTWFGGPRWKLEDVYSAPRLVDERDGHGAIAGTAAVVLFFVPLTVLGWIWIVK
jgi:rhomboid protease GluP